MNYEALFQNIYYDWQTKVKKNNWHFRDSFQALLLSMSRQEVEQFIPIVVTKVLEEQHDYTVWETLSFILALHVHAKRTTMHPELNRQWISLSRHISQFPISSGSPFAKLKTYFNVSDGPAHNNYSIFESEH